VTPAELRVHVQRFSCLCCRHYQKGKAKEVHCTTSYQRCRAGQPLTAYPRLFERRNGARAGESS